MKRNIKELYKESVLKEAKSPYHFSKMDNEAIVIEAYNPFCGDKYSLFLLEGSAGISELWFHGYGCAISKASISYLCRKMESKSWEEAEKLIREFYGIVEKNPSLKIGKANQDLQVFSAAGDFPGRLKCACLGWEALKKFLNEG